MWDFFNRDALAAAKLVNLALHDRIAQLEAEAAATKPATTKVSTPATVRAGTNEHRVSYPRKSWRQRRAAKEAAMNKTARNRKLMVEAIELIEKEQAQRLFGEEANVHI